jgi:hypothetical protein
MEMSERISLEDQYRSTVLLRDVMELLILDRVRTDEILKHADAPDVEALEALATTIKQNLYKCAASVEWLSGIIEKSPQPFYEWAKDQSQWRALKPDRRPKLDVFADPKRLTEWIQRIPEQVLVEVRDLDSQMEQLRSHEPTDGDLSKSGGCLLSGLCAVLAIATVNPVVAFGAGVGLGYCLQSFV